MISEEFGGDVWRISWGCSSWASPRDAPIQLEISFAPQDAATFQGPSGTIPPPESLIFWGPEERMWHDHGCVTPGRASSSAVLFSPKSPSPSHALACPWCHVGHWKVTKNLCYGALAPKVNNFLQREWILLEIFSAFLRILLDFINLKLISIWPV